MSFDVTRNLTVLSDGGSISIPGGEGYRAQILGEIQPQCLEYKMNIYRPNGEQEPGTFHISEKEFAPIITDAIAKGMPPFITALPQNCKEDSPQKPAQRPAVAKKIVKPTVVKVESPQNSREERACQNFQKFADQKVPLDAMKQALAAYIHPPVDPRTGKPAQFANEQYVSFADYSQRSTEKRFYLLDLDSGKVFLEKVSHGSGFHHHVDHGRDGYLKACSEPKSGKRTDFTRVGFFQVLDYYESKKHLKKWPALVKGKNGMQLNGLSPTNYEALSNHVVMHEAYYNKKKIMGRSHGCPAFVPGHGAPLIAKMRGGSLFYGYAGANLCQNEMKKVLAQIPGWEQTCGQSVPAHPLAVRKNVNGPSPAPDLMIESVSTPPATAEKAAVTKPAGQKSKQKSQPDDPSILGVPFAVDDSLAEPSVEPAETTKLAAEPSAVTPAAEPAAAKKIKAPPVMPAASVPADAPERAAVPPRTFPRTVKKPQDRTPAFAPEAVPVQMPTEHFTPEGDQ